MTLPGVGALGGVLGSVTFGVLAPTAMVSDGFYAMVGVVVSAVIGGTATVAVAYITSNANRRRPAREHDDDGDTDDDDLARRRR